MKVNAIRYLLFVLHFSDTARVIVFLRAAPQQSIRRPPLLGANLVEYVLRVVLDFVAGILVLGLPEVTLHIVFGSTVGNVRCVMGGRFFDGSALRLRLFEVGTTPGRTPTVLPTLVRGILATFR